MGEENKMGIYDYMMIVSIVTSIATQLYQQFKGDNPAPMTKEEWDALQPSLVEMRKAAVKSALEA